MYGVAFGARIFREAQADDFPSAVCARSPRAIMYGSTDKDAVSAMVGARKNREEPIDSGPRWVQGVARISLGEMVLVARTDLQQSEA